MGGTNHVANLIYVRVRVHFLLHVILAKAVLESYKKRARWCVICFSASNDKQLVRQKLKSRFVQTIREKHNEDLKSLRWYHDQTTTLRLFPEEVIPKNFIPGRLKLPSRAGVIYITDGTNTKRIKKDQPIPFGWALGQKPGRVKQISEQGKKHQMGSGTGKMWINNGTDNKYTLHNVIPAGWVKGRLKIGKFNPQNMRAKSAGTTGKTWITSKVPAV